VGVEEKLGIRELFPVQREAFEKILAGKRRLVVASPTGTGKTLVAYKAVEKALGDGLRVCYITPLRSLSRQKAVELEKLFPDKKVFLSTGDTSRFEEVEEEIAGADIVVATYERYDSLTRRIRDSETVRKWFSSLGLLVVDEAHMIGEERRGPALEGAIARTLTVRGDIGLVLIGAAIANPGELGEWISGEVVSSNWRPVKLKVKIVPSYGSILSEHWLIEEMDRVLREGGNILVFVMTRREAVEYAVRLSQVFSKTIRLSRGDREKILEACKKILSEHRSRLTEELCKAMKRGVAFHHAGLPRTAREVVEDLFYNRVIRLVVATTTLAYGVNYPARMVVITNVIRYYPEKGRRDLVPKSEILNMAGRAGRPGFDEEGYVVILVYPARYYSEAAKRYRGLEPDRVVSMLGDPVVLRSQILATLTAVPGREGLYEWVRSTLAYRQGIVNEQMVETEVENLRVYGMVEGYGATGFGELVARLYVSPDTAVYLRSIASLDVDYYRIIQLVSNVWEIGGVSDKEMYAIRLWVRGLPDRVIYEQYGIEPGRLYYLVENYEWITYALYRIAEFYGYEKMASRAKTLSLSIRYGVPPSKAYEALEFDRKHGFKASRLHVRVNVLARKKHV